jgi:hypothetical protein
VDDVTVAIASIPPRTRQLARAVGSATRQNRPPEAISIAVDTGRQGAWHTRTRAVSTVATEWVALLDDDDWLHPNHLEILLKHAEADPSVDYWFTYFEVHGGTDPLNHFSKVWDPEHPHQTTTTVMVRTELAKQVGWHLPEPGKTIHRQMAGEDFAFTLGCRDAGAKIVHIPEITWTYVHSAEPGVGNTSGMPDRW